MHACVSVQVRGQRLGVGSFLRVHSGIELKGARLDSTSHYPLSSFTALFLNTGFLSELRPCHFGYTGSAESTRDQPVSGSLCLGFSGMHHHTWLFIMGSGGPHACMGKQSATH